MRKIQVICHMLVLLQFWACGGTSPSAGVPAAPPPGPVECPAGYSTLAQDPNRPCSYACTKTSEEDVPDPKHEDTNCDGIDGRIARAVFVDGSLGSDDQDGSINAPVKTIKKALELSQVNQKEEIYISEGTYVERVSLVNGISIYGGYSRVAGWQRDISYVSTIQSDPNFIGDQIGITALDIHQTTVVADVQIQLPDGFARNWGASNYGVFCIACNMLNLARVRIVVGKASDGFEAIPGRDGRAGGNGGGGDADCRAQRNNDPRNFGSTRGGAGGTSSIGGNGGAGGRGGQFVAGLDSGGDGQRGSNGALGGAGAPSSTISFGDPEGRPAGGRGQDGANGLSGDNGTGGRANHGLVNFLTGKWASEPGGEGSPADNGEGGGGGGGSGTVTQNVGFTDHFYEVGHGGGGGGGGGEGGKEGGGGGGGGGCFGVYAINSSGMSIQDSWIQCDDGGNGGAGGRKGLGGSGGRGGIAAKRKDSMGACIGADAGDGGDGGRGGDGGAGGGGAGGPSFAIFTQGGAIAVQGKTELLHGWGGFGGAGGLPAIGGQGGLSGFIHDQ